MFVLCRLTTRLTSGQYGRIKATNVTCRRWATTRETGAILLEPEISPLGIVKVLLTVLPGLYIGASISKTCAAFLEENDIFVPDDDDDDD